MDKSVKMGFHRRRFLTIGAQAALTCFLPVSAIASMGRLLIADRRLFLYNTHTDESLDVCYYSQGRYQTQALKEIDHILRDHRTETVYPIHKGLIHLLHSISTAFDHSAWFHIISGYRSPETNAMLRKKTNGVAKSSLHMKGKAVDIRIPGYDTKLLRRICMKLHAGGVGYYPKSDFVHVDIGRIRYW